MSDQCSLDEGLNRTESNIEPLFECLEPRFEIRKDCLKIIAHRPAIREKRGEPGMCSLGFTRKLAGLGGRRGFLGFTRQLATATGDRLKHSLQICKAADKEECHGTTTQVQDPARR
jgi:hypothetical protein